MTFLDYDGYQALAKRLYNLVSDKSLDCGTYEFATKEEGLDLAGCDEPLCATVVEIEDCRAVFLHWGATGDWSRALLVPEENFYVDEDGYYCWVIEAIEWFLRR